MSVYVFVTRRDDPLTSEGPEISKEEWTALTTHDAELVVATEQDLNPDKRERGTEAVGDVFWNAHPEVPQFWLEWVEGQIEVKNPDEACLRKLAGIAHALGAQLISENGELFDSEGQSLWERRPASPAAPRTVRGIFNFLFRGRGV